MIIRSFCPRCERAVYSEPEARCPVCYSMLETAEERNEVAPGAEEVA